MKALSKYNGLGLKIIQEALDTSEEAIMAKTKSTPL